MINHEPGISEANSDVVFQFLSPRVSPGSFPQNLPSITAHKSEVMRCRYQEEGVSRVAMKGNSSPVSI